MKGIGRVPVPFLLYKKYMRRKRGVRAYEFAIVFAIKGITVGRSAQKVEIENVHIVQSYEKRQKSDINVGITIFKWDYSPI